MSEVSRVWRPTRQRTAGLVRVPRAGIAWAGVLAWMVVADTPRADAGMCTTAVRCSRTQIAELLKRRSNAPERMSRSSAGHTRPESVLFHRGSAGHLRLTSGSAGGHDDAEVGRGGCVCGKRADGRRG
jgi:hypothetical protein